MEIAIAIVFGAVLFGAVLLLALVLTYRFVKRRGRK
jgi:hypothetical protein